MARLDRKVRKSKDSSNKVARPKNTNNRTLHILLVVNLLLTTFSCIPNYEKYWEIYKRFVEYLAY